MVYPRRTKNSIVKNSILGGNINDTVWLQSFNISNEMQKSSF